MTDSNIYKMILFILFYTSNLEEKYFKVVFHMSQCILPPFILVASY